MNGEKIKTKLIENFHHYNLALTFREMDTQNTNGEIEFLDILHCIDKNYSWGFKLKNFVKPTAIDALFLNGKSHHPLHVYKGIILGESRRMRRLNECDEDYYDSLQMLKSKCIRSGFDEELVNGIIEKTKRWKGKGDNTTYQENQKEKRLTWATEFPDIIKLSKQEKQLMPHATITYCRPSTLGTHLLKYRLLAHGTKTEKKPNNSRKCGKCGLCGNHGKLKNMVMDTNELITKKRKFILRNDNLNCRSFGIYAGQCKLCKEVYVGQTMNSFNTRWNQHRYKWNQLQVSGLDQLNKSDDQALYAHYKKHHLAETRNNLELSEAFGVIFLEKPSVNNLDVAENFWIGRTSASINIQRTFLPKYKSTISNNTGDRQTSSTM